MGVAPELLQGRTLEDGCDRQQDEQHDDDDQREAAHYGRLAIR
jgi:hypothetical protein